MDELAELKQLRSSVEERSPESKENARALLEEEFESADHNSRRRDSKLRRKIKMGLGLGALLAVVAFSPAGAAISDRANELIGGPQSNPAFTEKVSDAELARLSVLGSDPMPIEDLPAPLDHSLSSVLGAREESNIRLGVVDTGRERVGVAGNAYGICLTDALDGDGGTGCNTTSDVVKNGMAMVTPCETELTKGKLRILAVVPDGIDRVLLSNSEGFEKSVKVNQNIYETEADPLQTTIVGVDADGQAANFKDELDLAGMALGPGEVCSPYPGN